MIPKQVTLASAVNWFRAIVNGRERPKFKWEEGLYKSQLNENMAWAKLTVTSDIKPVDVVVKVSRTKPDYTGEDFHRRDWRWTVPKTDNSRLFNIKIELY